MLNIEMVIERSLESVSFNKLARMFNTNSSMLRYDLGKARKLELVMGNVKRNRQEKKELIIKKYRDSRAPSEKLKKNWV